MVQDIQALDTALSSLGDGVTALNTGVQKLADEVTALIAKIGTGTTPADLTNEVTAIQSMAAAISDDSTKLQAAIDAAKQVTGA